MSQKEKDIFESIDSLFTELNKASANINEFGKKVQSKSETISKGINESLKQNGYDNIKEFIDGEVLDKKGQKPELNLKLKEITSRYEFIQESLSHVTYDIKYRGYFKEGHQEAIQHGLALLEDYRNDLDSLSERIHEQLNEFKHHRTKQKDAYTNGYIQGCKLMIKTIQKSKVKMIQKVLKELHC